LKVLLLEDDYLISAATADLLKEEFGCDVTAVFDLDQAEQALNKESPQIGVLDVNIFGQLSFPIADLLHERHIPIVFVTGYDVPSLGGRWKEFPVCRKPCAADQLKQNLIAALSRTAASGEQP
jgi:DNA-binding response OmpR family regulator